MRQYLELLKHLAGINIDCSTHRTLKSPVPHIRPPSSPEELSYQPLVWSFSPDTTHPMHYEPTAAIRTGETTRNVLKKSTDQILAGAMPQVYPPLSTDEMMGTFQSEKVRFNPLKQFVRNEKKWGVLALETWVRMNKTKESLQHYHLSQKPGISGSAMAFREVLKYYFSEQEADAFLFSLDQINLVPQTTVTSTTGVDLHCGQRSFVHIPAFGSLAKERMILDPSFALKGEIKPNSGWRQNRNVAFRIDHGKDGKLKFHFTLGTVFLNPGGGDAEAPIAVFPFYISPLQLDSLPINAKEHFYLIGGIELASTSFNKVDGMIRKQLKTGEVNMQNYYQILHPTFDVARKLPE